MIAGTLAQFDDPAPEPIEPFLGPGEYPAVTVETTQKTVDASTLQAGQVAGRVKESRTDIFAGEDNHGEPFIEVDRTDTVTPIATDWYADATGAGIVLAESIAENVKLPFPFDVFGGVTEQSIERQQIDVGALHESWQAGGGLSDVWMAGTDERGTAMAYHGQAADVKPTMGIGFKRAWNGTTIKGVAWGGGYIALYSARHAADGLQFVADEILPFAEAWDPDEHEDQTDFEEFGGGA